MKMTDIEPVRQAFHRGCAKPRTNQNLDEAVAVSFLKPIMHSRLPKFDLGIIQRCEKLYGAGLVHSRAGEYEKAEELFRAAWAMIAQYPAYRETTLICTTYTSAAVAYLQYRQRLAQKAQDYLVSGMECDWELEDRFGYAILHIHRVHLVENFVKTHTVAGHLDRAFDLAERLLLYLSAKDQLNEFPGKWGPEYVASVPLFLVQSKFTQIAGEIANMIEESPSHTGEYTKLKTLLDVEQANGSIHAKALRWLAAKQAFVQADYECFLQVAAGLLDAGPDDIPMLWAHLLLDVCRFCKAHEEESCRELSVEILAWAANCDFLPPKITRRFRSLDPTS